MDGWIFSVSWPQINESYGFQPRHSIYSTITWEKMRTLCPSSLSFFSIFWSSVSFPEDFTSRLPSYEPLGNTGASCKDKNQIQASTGERYEYLVILISGSTFEFSTRATGFGIQVGIVRRTATVPSLPPCHQHWISSFEEFALTEIKYFTKLFPYHSSHGEQVGMVAALLQVHHNVEQGHLVPSTFGVQSLKIPCQNKLVIFPAGQRSEIRFQLLGINYFHSLEKIAHHLWKINSLKLDLVIKIVRVSRHYSTPSLSSFIISVHVIL